MSVLVGLQTSRHSRDRRHGPRQGTPRNLDQPVVAALEDLQRGKVVPGHATDRDRAGQGRPVRNRLKHSWPGRQQLPGFSDPAAQQEHGRTQHQPGASDSASTTGLPAKEAGEGQPLPTVALDAILQAEPQVEIEAPPRRPPEVWEALLVPTEQEAGPYPALSQRELSRSALLKCLHQSSSRDEWALHA